MSRRSGRRYRILESGERARFLNQFNPHYRLRRDRLACRLMLDAGLRVGEVVALRPEHVRWQTRRVVVREGKVRSTAECSFPTTSGTSWPRG